MPAPTLPIRLGVIGLSVSGGWSATLLGSILTSSSPTASKYKLTALATRSAESASATAKKYSEQLGHPVKAYHGPDGARALANDPEVDLVAVVVKVTDHKAAVLPALEAGKDVFVEWPLARNLEEVQEIVELARKKGVRSMVGTQVVQMGIIKRVRPFFDRVWRFGSPTALLSHLGPRCHPIRAYRKGHLDYMGTSSSYLGDGMTELTSCGHTEWNHPKGIHRVRRNNARASF